MTNEPQTEGQERAMIMMQIMRNAILLLQDAGNAMRWLASPIEELGGVSVVDKLRGTIEDVRQARDFVFRASGW